MMKRKNLTIMIFTSAVITLLGFSSSVLAGVNGAGIDKVQKHQKGKLVQGVRSGELTGKETYRLGKQQKRIYQKEQQFKEDGNFTKRERAIVYKDLAKASGNIYKQKHDGQDQGARNLGVNKRENQQAKHIAQGVRSGALTKGETARLGKQQLSIHRQERRFKSDGTFNKRERARIHRNQNQANKNIYRAKHNRKSRS